MSADANYLDRRGEIQTYFDRTAAQAWERLTSTAPVGRIRATVRAGRDRMRSTLLSWLPEDLQGRRILDAGCGTGALGLTAAMLSGTGRVLMVDADAEAVRCASRGITKAGVTNAEVRASDVGSAVGDERFDVVVANPPFHQGKTTDLLVPRQFIADAYAHLNAKGRLLLVANRTLPYEQLIADRFGEVRTLHDGRRFKVLSGTR